MGAPAGASFSVDVAGLLEALTEQFPDPLLCVRELIQNAADAGARRIDVDVSYDSGRSLVRLSVVDDGRGMNAQEVEGYLTIGLSEKSPEQHRGRFGVGKLSPYALGFERMTVETFDGTEAHRLDFLPDGSGSVDRTLDARSSGTVVRVYKACGREEAEQLSSRTFGLARESCGSIGIPLFVNRVPVNHDVALPSPYAVSVEGEAGSGVIGLCSEPVRTLMGGGIVLESGAPILGSEVSYILDGPKLSPTLSRNAVRRDLAFDALLHSAQSSVERLVSEAGEVLRRRVERFRKGGAVVERALEADDRAALEWLRARLLDPDLEPGTDVKSAPVLETADGDLVSASQLAEVLRRERRIPISRVPRTRDEIAGYVDRGIPVLLLYRDLEDFLERQDIATVEVDGLDDGVEIAASEWGRGETALLGRSPLERRRGGRGVRTLILSSLVVAVLVGATLAQSSEGPQTSAERRESVPPAPEVRASEPNLSAPSADYPPSVPWFAWACVGGALICTAAGLVVGLRHRAKRGAWLRDEAGIPLARGEGRRRRLSVLLRMVLHPVDFAVARGWSARSSGGARNAISGYRAFAQELPIKVGARLDLDRLELGFVDLISKGGDPSDARLLVRRGTRILLNRNHPTVAHLTCIAEFDPRRAHVLLEALLATDPELAQGCDPRQVEWDLVGRAPSVLAARTPS